MKLFRVVIRFNDSEDKEFRFESSIEALGYFDYLVRFELDSLIHNVWSITLLKSKKPLKHYSNYLHL